MDIVKRVEDITASLLDMFRRKNANYGNSVVTPPVLAPDVPIRTAIQVRMSDKIARLNRLVQGEPDKVGESMEETVKDLVVYGLIWLAAEEK